MMLFITLPLLACFQGLTAVQWTSTYLNTTTTCSGHNLTLGWNYRLEPGETLEDITWLFASGSGHTPSIIASYVYGIFSSAPSYGSRLTHLNNGKVVLTGVTPADIGTYVTEVITRKTTGFSSIRRNVVVTLTDPSIYRRNAITVRLDDQTVPDAHGQLHVRLACGPLAWRGEPPVDVIWTTPSGAELNSTGYENSTFYLALDNPVVSGVYACGLPASATSALCLQAGDPLTRQATVLVDTFTARIALLEANLQQVKGDNLNLTQQLQDVTEENSSLRISLQSDGSLIFHLRKQLDQCLFSSGP